MYAVIIYRRDTGKLDYVAPFVDRQAVTEWLANPDGNAPHGIPSNVRWDIVPLANPSAYNYHRDK